MEAHTERLGGTAARTSSVDRVRRLATETKQAFKTTEFWAFVAVVVGILVSAMMVDGGESGTDGFGAQNAWLYVAIVTSAYIVGRGLAKAGTADPYTADQDDRS